MFKYAILFGLAFISLNLNAMEAKKPTPPVTVQQPVTYDQLLPFFNNGASTTEKLLSGYWKLVATTSSRNCSFNPEMTDWDGIKNACGLMVVFGFGYYDRQVVGANPVKKVFGMMTYNQGNAEGSQGPFQTSMTEPQFAIWGYVDGHITSEAFYNYTCRLVQGNNQQLVCANQLSVSGSLATNPSTRKCAADAKGNLILLVKYHE